MKVDRNAPVRSTRSVAQAAYARRVEAAGGVASNESVGPSASVLGILEADFIPKVRDAIMGLMSEVDNLRRELNQTRVRLEDMEKAADQDGMLPLLNRRAFVRELTRYIAVTDRYNTPASDLFRSQSPEKDQRHAWACGRRRHTEAFRRCAGDACARYRLCGTAGR
jgi:hypothetical protein